MSYTSNMRPHYLLGLALTIFASLAINYFVQVKTINPGLPASPVSQSPEPASAPLGQTSKSSGCVATRGLADKACTPGAILAGVTKDQICVPGYSKKVRNVPQVEKSKVYAEYGISSRQPNEYEVDHLISLELGGSNDISNLWPELAQPTPGFHEKDLVENYLHAQVCQGSLPLADAQQKIAGDWLAVYRSIPNPSSYK